MERISLVKVLLPGLVGCTLLAGCSSANTVSEADQETFKHPGKLDMSKVPSNAFKPNGPAFIGKPSGATHPTSAAPPQGK